ncbi:unannotated protein [freshwater metagenome]|uniref:Unannotated protein n=1 Tax=freshwater metagenome TaxID=449393 RepID=A0A6J5YT02_9ZZZZ
MYGVLSRRVKTGASRCRLYTGQVFDDHERFSVAIDMAREAGTVALEYFGRLTSDQLRNKGPHDLVSEADLEVEQFIRNRIEREFPTDKILGEEQGGGIDTDSPLWVIDPIDGTGEFVRGSRNWCIVISFVDAGATQFGVVYSPMTDEMFTATVDGDALLNSRKIACASANNVSQGVITLEHSSSNSTQDIVSMVTKLLDGGGNYVREGSGALGICNAACGRSLGFIELSLKSWDCLGPLLIATRAGCITTDFIASGFMQSGGPVVVAATNVSDSILALLPQWARNEQVLSNP